MENPFWHLSLKLHNKPKSVLPFPEDVEPGGYMVATIKQLVSAQLPDSLPDPELIGLSCYVLTQQTNRVIFTRISLGSISVFVYKVFFFL